MTARRQVLLTSPGRVESECLAALLREESIDVCGSETTELDDVVLVLAVDLPGTDVESEVARTQDLLGRTVPVVVMGGRSLTAPTDSRHVLDVTAATGAVLVLVRKLLHSPDSSSRPRISVGETDRRTLDVLTPREQEIAELAAHGLRNEEIARRLKISAHTVRTHLGRVRAKLDVQHRVALSASLRRADDASRRRPSPASAAGSR